MKHVEPIPGESLDASQRLNIAAAAAVPLDCHLFLRPEPEEREPGRFANLHRHDMLFCCLEGRGCLAVDGAPYLLDAGDAMLVGPGQPHARLPLAGEGVRWLVIRFSMAGEPEWLALLRNKVFHFDPVRHRLLAELREACARFRAGSGTDASAAECLLRLALLLNSLRDADGRASTDVRELPPAVRRLCRVLVTARGGTRTFAELAREQGVSAGHLRALFKRAVGKPPGRVRSDERRRRAVHLLAHTELNISEIAARLGFGSIYAFSRFFKRGEGISPLKFRLQLRKKP